MSTWHHLVAPESLEHWFRHFTTRPPAAVHHIGSGALDGDKMVAALPKTATHVCIHSSHDSLRRDCEIADRLRGANLEVVAQSRLCVELGTDKARMKKYLANAGFHTPAGMSIDQRWVVKRRGGTEAIGMRFARSLPLVGPEELMEQFIDGEEFSVVLFAWRNRVITFPPVYKGPTRPDLLPPYRRPRVCPTPARLAQHDALLRAVARRLALAVSCQGWLEVEFAVNRSGEPVVFEFNPRVSGTMRISAMATEIPIFDLAERFDELDDDLQASRFGAEVPWTGDPIADPAADVFATSRLTTAAGSIAQLCGKLGELGIEPIPYWQPQTVSVSVEGGSSFEH